ncbi:MAG: hypothetical protein QXD41_01990 [Nitrososphaeria archaeon]
MEKLGLDYKLLIGQIINFALVFFLLKKFLAPTLLNFIKKEKQIEKEKEETELLVKEQRDRLVKEEAIKREQWKKQASEILKKAREEGEKQRSEIIKQAKIEAEQIKKKAREQAQEEEKEAERAIKKRIIEMSISIVEEGLKKFLDEEGRKRATEYIIKNYSQEIGRK